MDYTAQSQNDRMMGVACHVSSLVGFGIIAPLVIYFTQRDRSGFVARHALQALFLQIFHLVATVISVFVCLVAIGAFVGISLSATTMSRQLAALSLPFILTIITGFGVPTLLYFVAMIVGAIECFQGKEANLPILGNIARGIHGR